MWVIDEEGNLRIALRGDARTGVKHTQLVNAAGVYGAGEVQFGENGEVSNLNAESGGYMEITFGRQFVTQALIDSRRLFDALGH